MANIKQTLNNVVIEGQLAEVDLEYAEYQGNDVIRGDFKVRVVLPINGEDVELDVPVRVYHNRITRAGKENPAYNSINSLIKDYASIAAVGEEEADYIRVTGADIRMQEYYPQGGEELVSYPSVQGSFVNKVAKTDISPKANWELEVFIHGFNEIVNENEDYLEITGIGINYDGSAAIIPIKVNNKKIAEQMQSTFSAGQTVPMSGYLNFTSKIETVTEEAVIGEPIVKERTVRSSEIILTGAKAPIPDAYTAEEIQQAVALRNDKLAANKQKQAAKVQGQGKSNTQQTGSTETTLDLGF